jgi:ribosomal protein S18 acetylase RimI-like enzyme
MALVIRAAEAADYEWFCALIAQSDAYHAERRPTEFRLPAEPGRPRDWFDKLMSAQDDLLLLAESSGSVVGVACASLKPSPSYAVVVPQTVAYVWDLVVDRDARRQGVGRALMAAVEAWARERGAAECRLDVFDFNDAAIALYDRVGYRPRSHSLAKRL